MKNKIVQVLISNRFKSFYWRTGMMVLASALAFFADNIALFEFNATVTVVLGLVLGEVSKAVNNELSK
jgi:hypothetical protein